MTRSVQKAMERFYAEETARRLETAWVFLDHEAPDFLVQEGAKRFGLEVCMVFAGPKERGASQSCEAERQRQRRINNAKANFEASVPLPLNVSLLGYFNERELDEVVRLLRLGDWPARNIGERVRYDLDNGRVVFAMKALRAEWLFLNDQIGWGDQKPEPLLNAEIQKNQPSCHLTDCGVMTSDFSSWQIVSSIAANWARWGTALKSINRGSRPSTFSATPVLHPFSSRARHVVQPPVAACR